MKIKGMEVSELIKNTLVVIMILFVVSSVPSSAYKNDIVEDVFMITIATQDESRSTEGSPHYISSDITLESFDEQGNINYGPIFETTKVDSHDDIEDAYVTFFGIPDGSIVRYENSAEGFVSDVDEMYLDTGARMALYEDEVRHYDGDDTKGYQNDEDGFTTTCDFDIEDNFPYYDCYVVDENGIGGGYYLYLSYHGEGDELYAEMVVTNKLWPEEESEDDDSEDDTEDEESENDEDESEDESDEDEDSNEEEDTEDEDSDDQEEDENARDRESYKVSNDHRVSEDVLKPGDEIDFRFSVSNEGRELESARGHAILYGVENDVYERYVVGPFDLRKGDDISRRLGLRVPEGTEPGTYHVRVTLGDGSYRMVEHKEFIVQ